MNSRALLCLFVLACAAMTPAVASIQSTFDQGAEGWTQMDLDGDIRYVVATPPAEPGECQLEPPMSGVLWFRDPDAGEWVFEAPAKFLGNQSAMFGGTIQWSQHHKGCLIGDPPEPAFRVVLVNTNKAIGIVMIMAPPPDDQWVSNSVKLDDQAGWAWVDDTTGQEDLPTATAAQIQEVLQSVTGFRIVGEFITGDDIGSLDNVAFSNMADTESPRLSVGRTATNTVVVSWPSPATGWTLQQNTNCVSSVNWSNVTAKIQDDGTNRSLVVNPPGGNQFYRLKQ